MALPYGAALLPLLLPPLPVDALLSRAGSGAKVKEKGRERGRSKGQKGHFMTVLSLQSVKMNKIRSAVSSSIIVINNSIFQQMALFWVSVSK